MLKIQWGGSYFRVFPEASARAGKNKYIQFVYMPNPRYENILCTCHRMMRRGRLTINAIYQKLGVTTYKRAYTNQITFHMGWSIPL
jgi:hypothetical protein